MNFTDLDTKEVKVLRKRYSDFRGNCDWWGAYVGGLFTHLEAKFPLQGWTFPKTSYVNSILPVDKDERAQKLLVAMQSIEPIRVAHLSEPVYTFFFLEQ